MNIADPIVIRNRIQEYANNYEGEVNARLAGVIVGNIEKYLRSVELAEDKIPMQRRLVFGYLLGLGSEPISEMSSKEISNGGIYALKKWIGAVNVDDEWLPREQWKYELYWVRARAMIVYNYHLQMPNITLDQYNYLIRRDGYGMDDTAMRDGIDSDSELAMTGISLGGDVFELDKVSKGIVHPYLKPVNDSKPVKSNAKSVAYVGSYEDLL